MVERAPRGLGGVGKLVGCAIGKGTKRHSRSKGRQQLLGGKVAVDSGGGREMGCTKDGGIDGRGGKGKGGEKGANEVVTSGMKKTTISKKKINDLFVSDL